MGVFCELLSNSVEVIVCRVNVCPFVCLCVRVFLGLCFSVCVCFSVFVSVSLFSKPFQNASLRIVSYLHDAI